jgi:L-alanine-DL-glutamate epimerase-like enolase superfamily enzyme
MQIRDSPLPLTKRYPLTISRGTSAGSDNLLVEVTHGGITGLGEMAPVNIGYGDESAAAMLPVIESWAGPLEDLAPWEMQRVEERLACVDAVGAVPAARAALDMALYDWLGKQTGMPVYALLGLDPGRIVPTSITVGINPPDVVRERVPELLSRLRPRYLKVKLGSPAGPEADREMFEVVRELTPPEVGLRVDANGGWSGEAAITMCKWLAERGVAYVEQPLPVGREAELAAVRAASPIPLFADESCRFAADVPKLAGLVDGINLKLMKAGGIREGLRVIHTAKAHGLKVMMGCMSESSLAIAASVHLSPLADFLDLDSHLNLLPDPCCGLRWEEGRVLPSEAPGLGVRLTE